MVPHGGLSKVGCFAIGYADNVTIILSPRKFGETVSEMMQSYKLCWKVVQKGVSVGESGKDTFRTIYKNEIATCY